MDIFTHDIRYAIRMLLKQPAITATMLLTLGARDRRQHRRVFRHPRRAAARASVSRARSARDGVREAAGRRRDGQLGLPGGLSRLGAAESVVLGDGRVSRGHGRSDRRGRSRAAAGRRRDVDVLRRARRARAAWPHVRRRTKTMLGRHRVVVLGHALWQQRFGGDPGVIGRTITLNGIPQEIIGVLPAGLRVAGADRLTSGRRWCCARGRRRRRVPPTSCTSTRV